MASRHEAQPAYIEFAVQSNFSFLRGASKPEELVVTAALLGHAGMGLADRNTVAGVVRAWSQSKHIELEKSAPIKLPYHPGARLVFCDGTPDVLAYPQRPQGLGESLPAADRRPICATKARRARRSSTATTLWNGATACRSPCCPISKPAPTRHSSFCSSLADRFGKNIRLAVAPAYAGNDRFRLEQAAALAAAAGMQLMAVNDVLYHASERRPLQDVLTAIRLNVPVSEAGFELRANAERHLKTPVEMARLFRHHPEALAETIRFAERTRNSRSANSATTIRRRRPRIGVEPQTELERLTWEGAARRYPDGVPEKVSKLHPDTNSRSSRRQKYARYFLTVHDIVRSPARRCRHPLPGTRLRRQFGDLLLPRHHRRRPRP